MESTYNIPVINMRNAIKTAIDTVSKDSLRININNAILGYHDKNLRIIATDGQRLSSCKLCVCEEKKEGDVALLSKNSMKMILSMIGKIKKKESSEEIEVRISEDETCFFYRGLAVVTENGNVGTFPRWRDVVKLYNPTGETVKIAVNPIYLKQAAKACKHELTSKNHSMTITATVEDGKIKTSAPVIIKTNKPDNATTIYLMQMKY